MLEPSSFRFASEANYLDHPSPHSIRGLSLPGAIKQPSARAMLLVFLIAGPPRPRCMLAVN
jgi:hypothetical protein